MTLTQETSEHLYKVIADLPLCGCGIPEPAYQLVVDLLKVTPFYDHREQVASLAGSETEGAHLLVLGALDHAGLIEHGSSIGGSWITPKGKWFLQAVELAGGVDELCDATRDIGYPHAGGKCTDACWETQPS